MKLLSLSAAAMVLIGLSAANMAQASDGTINFNGLVTALTCTSSGADTPVQMKPVSTKALSAAGASAMPMQFALKLSDCTGAKAQTLFEMGPSVNSATGNLKNMEAKDGAQNVEIALVNDKSNVIDIRTNQNSQLVDFVDKGATMIYYAKYIATDEVTEGPVSSSVTFAMTYE